MRKCEFFLMARSGILLQRANYFFRAELTEKRSVISFSLLALRENFWAVIN